MNNRAYCRKCFSQRFPENSTAIFEKSDAKFSCPKKCGAENLSFDQFTVGLCCDLAAKWNGSHSFYKIGILNKLYEESRNEEGDAENKVVAANTNVEVCQKALEDAENEAENARKELNDKKKWRRLVQKRTLFMTSIEMEKDDADLEKKIKADDSGKCVVCFEIYGEGDRQKSAIFPCGHQACFGCLTSLPQKSCPTCRADFTDDKILKLFPSGQN